MKTVKLVKFIKQDEENDLLGALWTHSHTYQRDRAILIFLLNTGLRVGELVGLNIIDVKNGGSEPRRELKIRSEIAKGGKERYVPLNEKARDAIRLLINFNQEKGFTTDSNSPLIQSRKHGRLSSRQIERLIAGLSKDADLDIQVTPHSLRHTFATRILNKTGNLRTVQTLLGHSNISTTQIYTHVTRDDLENAVSQL